MWSRRIRGALAGFLGTFVSRNSDHGGAWLFGYLAAETQPWVADLIGVPSDLVGVRAAAMTIARARFSDQLDKARVPRIALREARVEITPLAETRAMVVWGRTVTARGLRVGVTVRTVDGGEVSRATTVFAAPQGFPRPLRSE